MDDLRHIVQRNIHINGICPRHGAVLESGDHGDIGKRHLD
jgi:hypothetical protein